MPSWTASSKNRLASRFRQGTRPRRGAGLLERRRCWIYLNTSGQKVSDRNYRKLPFSAPLRESLAAAIIMATGYDGTQPLVCPMCGSGTLAIEAALIASRRVPGLMRSNFAFMHTKLLR